MINFESTYWRLYQKLVIMTKPSVILKNDFLVTLPEIGFLKTKINAQTINSIIARY
jgi:hypothetical protein